MSDRLVKSVVCLCRSVLEDMRVESEEQHAFTMTDLASVRLVHGPVMNRMTKQEVIPRVEFISFCPHSSTLFCVTGTAIFKIFQLEQQSLHQQIVHFRAEFYAFTCHCWLDANSIVVGVCSAVNRSVVHRCSSSSRQPQFMGTCFGFKMVPSVLTLV